MSLVNMKDGPGLAELAELVRFQVDLQPRLRWAAAGSMVSLVNNSNDVSSTTTTSTTHPSDGAGGAGSEMRTVIQIRNAAVAEVTRSVKGVSPVTMMNSLKRCEDEAKAKEDNDLTGAYFKLIQAGR